VQVLACRSGGVVTCTNAPSVKSTGAAVVQPMWLAPTAAFAPGAIDSWLGHGDVPPESRRTR